MASLLSYVVRRILFAIPVFITVSVLTFLITNAAGNPVTIVRLGIKGAITPQYLALLNNYFHVNQPLYIRYFYWLSDFVQGNWGTSYFSGTVSSKVVPWIGITLELQIPALLLSLLIGIPIGIYSAKRQYSKADFAVTSTAIFGVSMPTFWLGIMLIIVFALDLRWLPSYGALSISPPYIGGSVFTDALAHVILPLSVLTFVSLAAIVRLVRANMLETLRQDFILAARASGVDESRVTYRHALKNAITPVVTVVGLTFGTVLGGAPGLETTFSWPGLGYEFVVAANNLDLPIIQTLVMVITVMVLVANIATDLAYAYLDPRVRL
ncbi:MAG TPA: ABC transporter permease [Nitrososphaerales archaeon]|nr:ABC transporter permease [Nitrososphaerales archaeon]